MYHLRLDLNPVPASRPRVTRWGAYYGKRHQAFRESALALLETKRDQGVLPKCLLSGGLQVWVLFQVKKPPTSKLETPRGDIDNYLKLLLDCCTGFLWQDDRQVDQVFAQKVFAKDTGSIDLWVEERNYDTTRNVSNNIRPVFSVPTCPQPSYGEGFYLCPRGFVSVPCVSTSGEDNGP